MMPEYTSAGVAMGKSGAVKLQNFSVSIAESDSDKDAIRRFRYDVLVDQFSETLQHADSDTSGLGDPLDHEAIHLTLSDTHGIAATIRILRPGPELQEELRTHYQLERFSSFGWDSLSLTDRLTVSPHRHRGEVTRIIFGAAYKVIRQLGARFEFCACGPGMVAVFERLGYRRYTDNFEDEDSGYQVPLVLLTEDVEHMTRVGTPFLRISQEFANSNDTAKWFHSEFALETGPGREALMEEERLWQYLTSRLQQTPLEGIPLISGLTYAEASRLLGQSPVIQCADGDRVVRSGDWGREMFIVLSGAVEVRGAGGNVIATVGSGEMFGESTLFDAVRHAANIVAVGPTELITLSSEFLDDLRADDPRIAAAVFYNVARTLSARLHEDTEALRNLGAQSENADA